jgi:hypothetical protein
MGIGVGSGVAGMGVGNGVGSGVFGVGGAVGAGVGNDVGSTVDGAGVSGVAGIGVGGGVVGAFVGAIVGGILKDMSPLAKKRSKTSRSICFFSFAESSKWMFDSSFDERNLRSPSASELAAASSDAVHKTAKIEKYCFFIFILSNFEFPNQRNKTMSGEIVRTMF